MQNDYADYAEESKSYLQAPEGTKIARCVWIVKLGLQPGYKGNKPQQQVLFGWELSKNLEVFDESKGPKPYMITNTYNLILNDKSNFSLHLSGWLDGQTVTKDFNYFTLLGEPCVLIIKHKGTEADANKMRARVAAITALTEEQTCPVQINSFKVLTFNRWNEDTFNALPEWIRDKISISPEYKQLNQPVAKDVYQKKANPVNPFAKKNLIEEADSKIAETVAQQMRIPPTSSPEVLSDENPPMDPLPF